MNNACKKWYIIGHRGTRLWEVWKAEEERLPQGSQLSSPVRKCWRETSEQGKFIGADSFRDFHLWSLDSSGFGSVAR